MFSDDYYEKERSEFHIRSGSYGKATVEIVPEIHGRLDGYMHKRLGTLYNVPILYVDGVLWMSITPMEIQSHHLPIQLAEGCVGVAGLGMGYYVQRILKKHSVDEIVVYESNEDVIGLYFQNFGQDDKLTIIHDDFYNIRNKRFDFFYCDIYRRQCDMKAIEDMAQFVHHNPDVTNYHFWTLEAMILEMLLKGYGHQLPEQWKKTYYPFLHSFMQSDKVRLMNVLGNGHEIYEEFRNHDLFEKIRDMSM